MHMAMGLVGIGALVAGICAQAATNTWDGGSAVDNNWSSAANWSSDAAPVSSSDTVIQLTGTIRATNTTQDIASPFVLNRLEFLNVGSTAFSVGGSPLQVSANADRQPYFYLTRAATCTMSNPVEIPAGTTLNMYFTTYGLTLYGVVSGEGGIDKQDQDGGLTLDNGANSFLGGLTVRGKDKDWCKVNIQSSGAMGKGPVSLYGGTLSTAFKDPGGLIFNNATTHTNPISLFLDSPIFVGMTNSRTATVTLKGDILLSTNVLHLRGGGSGTVNGAISGVGTNAIQKSDPSTWTLLGANTFTGRVSVGGGTLRLGTASTLASAVPLTVAGGVLDLGGFAITNGGLTLSGGTVSNGALYAMGPNTVVGGTLLVGLNGPAGVTKSGSGTQVLFMTNAYGGLTAVAAGTLQFAKRVALYGGDTAQWTDANIVVYSGASLALNVGGDGEFTSGDLDILAGLGSATGGFKSGSLLGLDTANAAGGTFTHASAIGNPGGNMLGLQKLGVGTLTLSDANTYTGATRLVGGVLSVGSITNGGLASGLGMSGPRGDNLIFAGGALRYTGSSTRTDRGFKYAASTNAYSFEVSQPNTTLTFGSLSNSVFDSANTTIVKMGPGTLTFGKGMGAAYNFPVKAIHILEGRFQTETGNTVQHNVHNLASQGPAILLGDGAEMAFNNPMEDYISGNEMMVRYAGTQTCARITAGSWLLCGPTTNSAGVLLFNTHIFDVNDGADDVDLDIRGSLVQYTANANSHVRKTGAGSLRLAGASSTYRGTTIIRSGRLLATASVPKGGSSVLGACTNDVVVGDLSTGPSDAPTFAFEGPANSSFTFARGIAACAAGGAVSAIGCVSNANCTFSGPITVSNTLQVFSASSGTNALFITGGIAGPGAVTKAGTGTVWFAAANAYTGLTTLAAGTLRLSASERIADASPLRLAGGTLALAGFGETAGALAVAGSAVIDFGAGGSLACADSASQVWSGRLLLRNWRRDACHLYVGTSATLSKTQLKVITSPTGQAAAQQADGEVVLLPLGTILLVQ